MKDKDNANIVSVSAKRNSGSAITRSLSPVDICRDMVYRQALSRHISDMEARASEVMHAKKKWKDEIVLGQLEYELQTARKRRMCRENSNVILQQIKDTEERRKYLKLVQIEDASCHRFPDIFKHHPPEVPPSHTPDTVHRFKSDLDTQVHTEKEIRRILRQRDIEDAQQTAVVNLKEMERQKKSLAQKLLLHKQMLNEAWNRDLRVKSCWKSIEKFEADNQHECLKYMDNGMNRAKSALP